MKLIGINGFKTSGKDTTYKLVKSFATEFDKGHAGRVERRAFADNLKIMAALALGFEGDDETLIDFMNRMKEDGSVKSSIYGGPEQHQRLSGREYLQRFGQHAREVFGSSFWVDQVVPYPRTSTEFVEIWQTLGRQGDRVGMPGIGCITDVRYPNEAQRVLDCGGVIWEVIRPGIESDGHSSEKPLPPEYVTYTIQNDSDLNGLAKKVVAALATI